MEKWIPIALQHGTAAVGALLLAIAAVWWIEPTTNGGVAFLMFIVFVVALAALELVNKAIASLRRRRLAAVAAPATSESAPPPTSGTAPRFSRRRKARQAKS